MVRPTRMPGCPALGLKDAFVVLAMLVAAASSAAAQNRTAVEAAYGGAWFVDEGAIAHQIVAGGARWLVTPRLGVGPEATYMIGPGQDRDFTLTGNVWYAFRDRGLAPFVVGGLGLFRHSDRFGPLDFSSTEGAFTAGGGVRIPIGTGWYIAPDARVGWELHTRLHVVVGYVFP